MIRIQEHAAPHLKLPKFQCDAPLDAKLDKFPLLQTLNRPHAAAFIGRAGSGKTSNAIGMLTNPQLMAEVFNLILVCMPATSRASMEDCPLDQLPEDQLYEELTLVSLQDMERRALDMSKKGGRTLLFFDDCQNALKVPAIERLMVHLNSNRRHRKTCLWFAVQNYIKLPKQLRMGLTNIFLYSISKADMKRIHEELLEIPEQLFERVCMLFKQTRAEPLHEHTFLYWAANPQRFFLDYDELLLPAEDAGVSAHARKEDVQA